jgi:hypothetical protein
LPQEQCFTPAFIRTFAEAIKRSLMSSDIEIQVTSLQLICHVCPDGAVMTKEIQTCVEEGLTDYIFELLQASGQHHKHNATICCSSLCELRLLCVCLSVTNVQLAAYRELHSLIFDGFSLQVT